MLFIPSCCPGWLRILVCLSVLGTLRSVLTGSLEPLGGIMVCYMYYTDVFVGHNDNINNLKSALKAVLKGSVLNDLKDLDQLTELADGLEKFIGYSNGKVDGNGIGKSGQGGSYESSYNSSVKWPDCKSGSPCSGCSSCHQSGLSSGSCHGSCCPDCNVKKAAKIFLGFLPALYFGLKIVHERCLPQNSSQWPGWEKISIISGKPESALAKFLFAWGFDSSTLNTSLEASKISSLLSSLFPSGSPGILEKLYDASMEYFSKKYSGPTSSSFSPSLSHSVPSSPPKPPSTVRSMLLWLYGLRFTPGFSSLVLYCSSLCSPFGNSFHPDAFCYYIHVSCFLLPVSVISVIQCPDGSDSFLPSPSDWEDFSYPSDTLELFEKFCEYVRKFYIPLSFLRFQCKRVPGQAGWQSCWYGKKCAVDSLPSASSAASTSPCCSTSDPSSQGYLCTAFGSNWDVHGKHCDPKGKGCINANGGSCTQGSDKNHNKSQPNANCKPCPHPLQRFLCDGSESQPKNSVSPFRLPFSFARLDFSQTPPVILPSSDNFLTMGFSPDKLSPTAKPGSSLGHVLHVFCDDGFYPLARLLEFALYVTLRPPSTLLELFVFFRKFVYSDVFKTEFPNYASGEPGSPSGENLRIAVQRLFNHTSHSNDLKSLYDCDGPKGPQNSYGSPVTCGKYLFYLYNVDGIFIPEFCAMYLSWICHLGLKLHAMFQKFYDKAQKKFSKCCLSSSPSPCQNIVSCPCVLPFLYKSGFTFWSPKTLSCHGSGTHKGQAKDCTMKSCKNFIDQLGKVLEENSPLQKLLDAIDAFLWSIREPFFLFVLAFWILVFAYFIYVQLYKLDILELNSHDHPAWSFKIPPSILFSDASSRLKDLSYFSL
ncbi:variant erythrocyte surface antigen-1 family protein [Babesia divergens]|uniref:Variant erythrocyte surface antigen-1 family protein n=1 Tax=Babesia divergens TaxID=32595 RepID=A0AAD9GG98_BABDI|nr:variant erythrocyte surface antigen-1 family protein [Babesia divergens]